MPPGADNRPAPASFWSSASGPDPHRKNDSREARSKSERRYPSTLLRDARRADRHARRRLFELEQELRARENRLERLPDAPFEARMPAAAFVEPHQALEIARGHRAPERFGREPADNGGGARGLFGRRGRAAREHRATTHGIRHAAGLLRPDDVEAAQVRKRGDAVADPDFGVGQRVIDRRDQIVHQALGSNDERRRHAARAGLHVNRRSLHLQTRLLFAHPRVDVEERHARAVDRHLELLAGGRAAKQQSQRFGVEIGAEDIVTVRRKRVHDRHAAARAERSALDAPQL